MGTADRASMGVVDSQWVLEYPLGGATRPWLLPLVRVWVPSSIGRVLS